MSDKCKPELLVPAGSLEVLKTAVRYGADAVYIGGEAFSLRAKAKNFTHDEMVEGIRFAHEHGARVHVTANIYARNYDVDPVREYFKELKELRPDAILIADPGVFMIEREICPEIPVHISTQANNTNYMTFEFWRKLGVQRVVCARELSLDEIKVLRSKVPSDMDIECFVHGAMCVSFSGRCLLSNYLTGRDANRGECSHPCRWQYHITESTRPGEYLPVTEDENGTYIFNSKDLCMIDHIPELYDAGVFSLKLEGRMKTAFYVATVVHAYREAIDDFLRDRALYESKKQYYLEEVSKASYRGFTTGFYFGRPSAEDQVYTSSSYIRTYDFVAVVLEKLDDGRVLVEQRNKFSIGDEAEILRAGKESVNIVIENMTDIDGRQITSAPHAQQKVILKLNTEVEPFDIIRKEAKK